MLLLMSVLIKSSAILAMSASVFARAILANSFLMIVPCGG
jgi:hypothetical protein